MDRLDNGPSPQPDVTEAEMFCVSGNNKTNEILLTRPADRLLGKNGPALHSILHQHDQIKEIFTNHSFSTFHRQQEQSWQDRRKLRQTMENTGCIWNSKRAFSKCYNPLKNLAADKVIGLFKGRVIFRLYIPKKHKCLGIKIYKHWDSNGHTWHKSLLREGQTKHDTALDRQRTTQHLTDNAWHSTWQQLTP
jgi:hypothetical protein